MPINLYVLFQRRKKVSSGNQGGEQQKSDDQNLLRKAEKTFTKIHTKCK